MKKNKEWLKEQVAHEQNDGLYFRENYSQYDYFVDVEDLLPLIDQLDEPETEERFYTFDNAKKWLQDNGFVVFEKDKLDEEVQRMIDETYEAMNEKPVIPQFVADWIEDYRDHGGVIVDMLDSLTTELDSVSSVDNEVAQWFRENTEKMLKALMDGYEVEKEKKYRVRAGNRYVRFNLNGSIIGVKKNNSIVCLERLSKLPFDYKKAVESGIITLEEVME